MENNSRILLVDDEPGTIEFVSRLLTNQGYDVLTTESGEDALKLLENDSNFDLILLDYLMVGLDGIETLAEIKKRKNTKDIKVLIQSGLSDVDDMEKARSLGAVGYILKPYKPNELITQIKKQLSK